jgi:hypothetical protein
MFHVCVSDGLWLHQVVLPGIPELEQDGPDLLQPSALRGRQPMLEGLEDYRRFLAGKKPGGWEVSG